MTTASKRDNGFVHIAAPASQELVSSLFVTPACAKPGKTIGTAIDKKGDEQELFIIHLWFSKSEFGAELREVILRANYKLLTDYHRRILKARMTPELTYREPEKSAGSFYSRFTV